ncbi:hypothetical protein ECL_00607 [Enterobacter cloacae subsp. cloacae ATCC 13047]|uniref:Uncharacterized protein n=1 Tax=Enterobacter cloacae subsp. cloacae (strain ATCC 13047 / DSM 30054 / NBRC 13535 / NCTC 10005 / WDCM 00083 / NCDC 279-56) TaxID=716541 RepID=A0A0H3CE91_ENTCC|nr:hypothetical protein ECL_00607 [Enterobacter cloacae subsp. cloacae ATCC 13047]
MRIGKLFMPMVLTFKMLSGRQSLKRDRFAGGVSVLAFVFCSAK